MNDDERAYIGSLVLDALGFPKWAFLASIEASHSPIRTSQFASGSWHQHPTCTFDIMYDVKSYRTPGFAQNSRIRMGLIGYAK